MRRLPASTVVPVSSMIRWSVFSLRNSAERTCSAPKSHWAPISAFCDFSGPTASFAGLRFVEAVPP
jgi:hypothetical protein